MPGSCAMKGNTKRYKRYKEIQRDTKRYKEIQRDTKVCNRKEQDAHA